MDLILMLLVVADIYVIVYYRLMVRYYEERDLGPEAVMTPPAGTRRFLAIFGDLFMPPPYRKLSDKGRRYARRYWYALGMLALLLTGMVILFKLAAA